MNGNEAEHGACQRAVEICAPGSPDARVVQRPSGVSLARRWAALCFPRLPFGCATQLRWAISGNEGAGSDS